MSRLSFYIDRFYSFFLSEKEIHFSLRDILSNEDIDKLVSGKGEFIKINQIKFKKVEKYIITIDRSLFSFLRLLN